MTKKDIIIEYLSKEGNYEKQTKIQLVEINELYGISVTRQFVNKCKVELSSTLEVAKTLMDEYFYNKYKEGVINSISKMYEFKKKVFNGKGQFQAKPRTMFSEDTDKAIGALAKVLTEYIQMKVDIEEASNTDIDYSTHTWYQQKKEEK